MNFKPEIAELTLNETVFSKKATENVQGDIIVPDTKGDIARILQTDAVAVIDSKEVNGGRITVSGTVYANILYAPQEGGIESMNTTMSFSHISKCEADNLSLTADASVKSVEHSMYNSRKMNVKALIALNLSGTREVTKEVVSGCECDGCVESLRYKVSSVSSQVNSSDVLPFRETFDIPSGKPSAGSVLKCSASFSDRDFRLLSNKAVIRGNISVNILYKGEDGSVSKCGFVQPFTEITDAPGAEEDMTEEITATLSPFTASPAANGEGTARAFFVEGKVFVHVSARKTKQQEIITDMFAPEVPLELKTGTLSDGSTCKTVLVSQVKDVISAGDIREITDIIVRPSIDSATVNSGLLDVSGKADTELLCRDGNGEFITVRKTVPFICNGRFEGSAPSVSAEIISPTAEISGGNAEVRMTVSCKAEGSRGDDIICVTDAQPANSEAEEIPSLTIYSARSGDTLWSIAKRYRTPLSNIKESNKLQDIITEGQKIIIPR